LAAASADEERAAIVQFDGGGYIEWAEQLAGLNPSRPPPGLIERRRRQALDDAGRFLDRWGKRACELGWSAADLFAVYPQALDARPDMQGLCWLLEGRSVVVMTAETAVSEGRTGARLTHRRRPAKGGMVIWELMRCSRPLGPRTAALPETSALREISWKVM
jgi:hypothetical protein